MGNIGVRGDVTRKAVVTAFVDVSQYWVGWQITDGKVGDAVFGSIAPAANPVWNSYGACVAPVSDDTNDGLLFIGYSADANGNYDLELVQGCGEERVAVRVPHHQRRQRELQLHLRGHS